MTDWKGIVVHMTQGPDSDKLEADNIRAYHLSQGWQDIGYNFVVEQIEAGCWPVGGRPLNIPGAHCKYFNTKYLGVAFAGDFRTLPPNDEMLFCGVKLVAGLLDVLKLPAEGVLFRHSELRDTDCPGAAFPWERFKLLVAKARKT
jgi:hypothetical protein